MGSESAEADLEDKKPSVFIFPSEEFSFPNFYDLPATEEGCLHFFRQKNCVATFCEECGSELKISFEKNGQNM